MPTPEAQIPLEDDISDVIRKAMSGHGWTPENLAQQSGVSLESIKIILNQTSTINEILIDTLATTLELCSEALVNLQNYHPVAKLPTEVTQIVTPFGHAGVNTFIVQHGSHASVFDTGTDPRPILNHLQEQSLTLDAIYITHRHHDHIAGLPDSFPETPIFYADDLEHAEVKSLDSSICLTALETSGHFTPSRAYLIEGLDLSVCICGDILFAGSIGKTPSPEHYQQSLRHAKTHLMSLPDHTLLCTGHGPVTSVAQESQHNPFLAIGGQNSNLVSSCLKSISPTS